MHKVNFDQLMLELKLISVFVTSPGYQKLHLNDKSCFKANFTLFRSVQTPRYSTNEFNESWRITLQKIKHSCKYPVVILHNKNADEVLQAQPSILHQPLARSKPMRAL